MARAFRSATASPAATATPSPLPSKTAGAWGSGAGGLANLQWLLKKRASKGRHGDRSPLWHDQPGEEEENYGDNGDDEAASMFAGATPYYDATAATPYYDAAATPCRRKRGEAALTRLRAAILAVVARARRGGKGSYSSPALGSRSCVTGTIFGRRRGPVHVALQADPRAPPATVLELAACSTGALVREMASGLVRIALECEKTPPTQQPPQQQGNHKRRRRALVEEATWRAYCNGRKCGYAVRRECGADDWRVLRAVEPVSVGAGVLPDGDGDAAGEGDMMYMRAKFERVVGSRDSEAFYMVSPDGGGAVPELSIYLLRV